MTFPESQRVIYDKNPLEFVVCQLRFPPILIIDTEAPAKYQERVRQRYPILAERPGVDLGMALPPGLPPQMAKIIGAELGASLRGGRVLYDFETADGQWKITLSRDALAVTTTRYRRWEEFREHLGFSLNALLAEYLPAFFTRIGLRYKDVIRRPELGLAGHPWSDVLQPHIAAELSSPDVAAAVVQALHRVTISLEKGLGKVQLQHGLGQPEPNETPYIIDCDFFTDQRTETNDALERLDYFNSQAGRLFRWCIREHVHKALVPRPI